MASRTWLAVLGVGVAAFIGAVTVAAVLHEPIPRVHDEFSYVLISNAFASGHFSNPAPPVAEFFDTFHVLVSPIYASKYFPAQGVFLAIGEKFTGHPAAGIWLSAALTCAAACWMLQAWVGPVWGMLGGILAMVQFGIFSYWSQTYWGGMVAALGGALLFGAARRLWDHLSWLSATWFAIGLAILANSRPVEGFISALPISFLMLRRILASQEWKSLRFLRNAVIPSIIILLPTAVAMARYNRAITGSSWKPPYLLHEQQYEESPQFTFLPLRPRISYSSEWVRYYYEVSEMRPYLSQRSVKNLMLTAVPKLYELWRFYCGVLLSVPLVVPALLKRGRIRYIQIAILAGVLASALFFDPRSEILRFFIDFLAAAQMGLLWFTFDAMWPRLALATTGLVVFASFFTKWSRPHYIAPITCLVLFLQIEGLRRIWHWRPPIATNASRSERRRALRAKPQTDANIARLRALVVLVPLACAVSLGIQIVGRVNNWWNDDQESDATRHVLPLHDWSLHRAELQKWLEQQELPQLIFVRYFPTHNVNFEWVFNHADIMHSHVIWARDLGDEHNKLLLQRLPDRKAWLLEADRPEAQLMPYAEPSKPPTTVSDDSRDRNLPW